MISCPHCEAEIPYLNFREPSTQYGSVDIRLDSDGEVETHNWETSDTSGNGDVEYECPECNEDVRICDLIVTTEDDVEPEVEVATPVRPMTFRSTSPRSANRSGGEIIQESLDKKGLLASGVYCPTCNTYVPCDLSEEEVEIECIECSTIITRDSIINHA